MVAAVFSTVGAADRDPFAAGTNVLIGITMLKTNTAITATAIIPTLHQRRDTFMMRCCPKLESQLRLREVFSPYMPFKN